MTGTRPASRRQSLTQIFAVPFVVAVLSTIGLVSALVGNGIWDGVSWIALVVPIALCGWFVLPRRAQRRSAARGHIRMPR
jgi:hypothetical protein